MAEVRPYKELSFLIAFKATSMESRTEVTQWLKDREAVHVLADVWFLRGQYFFAGDIRHEFERFRKFDGRLVVLGLNEATGWAQKGLSEDAESWISKYLK